MSDASIAANLALACLAGWSIYKLFNERKLRWAMEARFSRVLDVEAEVTKANDELGKARVTISELRSSYQVKKAIYDKLQGELAIIDERFAFAEMGVYEPHFDFADSEQFKSAIQELRDEQKRLISADKAVICTTKWQVDGSATKGQTMTKRNIKLTLRAFNGECDAAISNARWNNVNAMEKRITRAREQIDKLNASNAILVAAEYANLKLKELHLTHEYREKLNTEKEARAEAARLSREEQKLLRDLERAQEKEQHYQKLLAKAQEEAAKVVGPQLEAYNQQIESLESELAKAHAESQRAQSMAEKTRCGYVYVISNIGAFGEDVIKIGMTRRLDPADRIRELGDASVPFVFDTHAVIYSEDAPALEHALHAEFDRVRINTQNLRKEFFRTDIAQIESAVKRLAPSATFFRDVEAKEYRETLARRREKLEVNAETKGEVFPAEI